MIFRQYVKFLINGGLIGLLAWVIQIVLFRIIGGSDGVDYAIASLITYAVLILLNFFIQRAIIFSTNGRFHRFIAANIGIMFFVSALSPVCREFLNPFIGSVMADSTGFMLAAFIGATPSFLLSRYFVFSENLGDNA